MKVAMPQVPKPTAHKEPPQEQPRELEHSESKTLRFVAETGKSVTDAVGKGVQKVDPLHIFTPNGT